MTEMYRILKILLSGKERVSLVKVLLLVLGMAIFDSLGIVSIMPFLAVASDATLIESNEYLAYAYEKTMSFGVTDYDDFLVFLGLASFSILVVSSMYRVFTQFTLNNFIELRRHSIGTRLFSEYLAKNYEFFLNKNTSTISKNILSEVDLLVQQVLRPLIQMVTYGIVVAVLLGLLIFVNPKLSLIIGVVFGGLYILFYSMARTKLKIIGLERLHSNEGRFITVSEALGGIKALKLGKSGNIYLKKFSPYSHSYSKSQALAVTINQVPQYLVEALAIGGVIMVTIIAILSLGGVGSDAFSEIIPLIGLYVFAAYRIQPALRSVYQGIASMKYGSTALHTVLDVFESPRVTDSSPADNVAEAANIVKFDKVLRLREIEYAYPKSNLLAIDRISHDIAKDSLTAVIGSSGSGKTTLVDIILGLLKPRKGQVCVDDAVLNAANIESYQRLIGYVPQDVYLADSTIAENIAFGTEVADIDMDKIIQVSRMVKLDKFCDGLEQGYQSQVGERGSNLSGGQKQRVGIARALYSDPKILVLDESTSALDITTEKQIISTLLGLKGLLTVIFITHKINSIKQFDNILYLAEGKIMGSGDYDSLASVHPEIFI